VTSADGFRFDGEIGQSYLFVAVAGLSVIDSDNFGRFDLSRRDVLRAGAGLAGVGAVSEATLGYSQGDESETRVTIKRDEYGVPHVYARSAEDREPVFYGFGYVTAEDRLYQLELYRRYYHGTVSELLGEKWVDFDKEARRNTAGGRPLEAQFDRQLTEAQRGVLGAFTEGINRYISEVRASDERQFHKGFHDAGVEPEPFTPEDAAGMFVASMAFFSGFQLETLGAQVVDLLTKEKGSNERAMELFGDLNWGNDPGAPTSGVQPDGVYHPPYTSAGRPSEASADSETRPSRGPTGEQHAPSNRVTGGDFAVPTAPGEVHEAEMERVRKLATGLDELGLPIKYGSNALAVQGEITESGDALIFGGPQMGFNTPSVMYEAGLHGPDFDIAGSTVAGYPFIMFGRNRDGAFTSTAGIDNCIQTFVESIDASGSGTATYEFRGEDHEVETDEQTIPVKDGEDVTFTVRRTRHGVVTQWRPEEGQAIAQTRSYSGRHMNCWRAFYEAQFASSTEEYREAAQRCDYALNFLWAGKSGDVGYFHLGRYPDSEAVEWDTRLPADGTKYELTDEDYLRAADDEVPYSVNPPAGYSAQWNNKPAPDWNNGDLSYSWSTDHRVQRIINLVERRLESAGSLNYEFLKTVVYDISFVDLRSIRFRDALLSALESADLGQTERKAKQQLERWDHYRQGSGGDHSGKYPPGYIVWETAFPKMLENVFADEFGSAWDPASYFLGYDYGKGTLVRVVHLDETELPLGADYAGGDPSDEFVAAFRSAVDELGQEFGAAPGQWRRPARTAKLDNRSLFGVPIGVGDAGDMPWVNRGTENHFVRLSEKPKAENVLPPGNDGYVAPDGTKSEHYDDQLELFVDFEYKQLLFGDEAVEEATESKTVIDAGESDTGGSESVETTRTETETS